MRLAFSLAIGLLLLATPTSQSVITAIPSGSVSAGDIVTLVATGVDYPTWTATGGQWCKSDSCTWTASADEPVVENITYWRSASSGTFTITATDTVGTNQPATRNIVVTGGG